MRRTTSLLLLALAAATLAGCAGSKPLNCNADAQCDSSDLCVAGQCRAEGREGFGRQVAGDISAATLQQTVNASVGIAPAAATATLTDSDATAHRLRVDCLGGTPSPAALVLNAQGSATVQIALQAPVAAGSNTVKCWVTSPSGNTTWAGFVINLNASGGSTGGTGNPVDHLYFSSR